jgi:hypothetical protein
MEQEKQAKRRGRLALPALVLTGVLAATSLGLSGCKQPAGPDTETTRTEATKFEWEIVETFLEDHPTDQTKVVEKVREKRVSVKYIVETGEELSRTDVTPPDIRVRQTGVKDKENTQVGGIQLPATTTIPNFGKNMNLIEGQGSILYQNSSDSAIHEALTYGEARASAEDLLYGMTDQAQALATFFNGATGNPKFTQLKNAESTINVQANTTTLGGFYGNFNTQNGNIIGAIFPVESDRTTFNKYLNAYKQWKYITIRDWQTEGTYQIAQTAVEDAVLDYRDLVTAIGNDNLVPDYDGIYSNGRGTVFGAPWNRELLQTAMKDAMKNQIKTALGLDTLTGDQLTRANAMAEALFIQLADDAAELHAFVDDVTKEGLEHGVTGLGIFETPMRNRNHFAEIAPQSGTRLAHVDAKFSPELIRGAYGSEYTGNFTPYRKDENGLA